MTFTINPNDDFYCGSSYVNEPGTYHATVVNVIDGAGPKGAPIDGFFVELEILDGSGAAEKHQLHRETFFQVDPSRSEALQRIAGTKAIMFFLATDLMQPDKLYEQVCIDPTHAIGRHCICKLVPKKTRNLAGDFVDTEWLQVHYKSIHHVDDPVVANVPKDLGQLKEIPGSFRHGPEWFKFNNRRRSWAKPGSDEFSDL